MSEQTPMRIQRKRVKGWRMPENTKSVTRPSKWGNLYRVIKTTNGMYRVIDSNGWSYHTGHDRTSVALACLNGYRNYITSKTARGVIDPSELRGFNLACYCKLCEAHKDGRPLGVDCEDCDPCHVDILLPLANS